MTEDVRWKQRLSNYQSALQQLKDAVAKDQLDTLQEQGMVQCFEYTCELAWKTLQDFLASERGYTDVRGPRPVIEQAFADGLIAEGTKWLAMLQDRNNTSHLYDETEVKKVLDRIRTMYFPLFLSLETFLTQQP